MILLFTNLAALSVVIISAWLSAAIASRRRQ